MADDYYKTLEIPRDASPADIQKAYRALARKYHPDLHPDDKSAKDKFKAVQAAFDVLNDPSKRELYDRYGSSFDKMGAGGPPPRGGYAGGGQAAPGFEDFDFSQFFGERFGGAQGGQGDPGGGGFADLLNQFRRGNSGGRAQKKGRPASGGNNVQSEMPISFQRAVTGGEEQLSVNHPSGKTETLTVKIPPGVQDGSKIRLRGQGDPGPGGGTPGDILLTLRVASHPYFQRRGNHLDVKVPVTLAEAVLGGKIDVPTPRGVITLRLPPRTSGGTKLRAKGRGVTPKTGEPGDLFAEIQIVLPPEIDAETTEAIRKLGEKPASNPRSELRW